ncbi:MAG: 3'(2'),5'-bisphosphate nucleotidase CysQ [Ilumatobacteraceae bacterium]|nr:3'(2'),5'-bisphosphate nucleotidase CysQ [Ilumatobacteraceae bacterium]
MTDAVATPGSPGETDAELAIRLAVEAGRLLVDLRADLFGRGAPPWQVMDNGDLASHRFLLEELRAARPEDAVMSEEGLEDVRRFGTDHCWIVDPLDGTNEFGEYGRVDWAVHVALWSHGRLSAGAVSLPALGLVFGTEPAAAVPAVERARPLLITSRNRNPYSAVVVARALDCDAVRLGSAGAKAMAVVMGEADVYVHDGGMYQWDSAAPVAVALAAGLHASRLDGSPLVYNERDPWLPDFVICRPELADPVLDALRAHRTQRTSWR